MSTAKAKPARAKKIEPKTVTEKVKKRAAKVADTVTTSAKAVLKARVGAKTGTAMLPAKAEALLDAHVSYWQARLTDDAVLEAWMRVQLDAILADASTLKLKEVVSPAQIKAVAKRYAVELDLKGGIPELVGNVGTALYASPAHDKARVVDVLPEKHFLQMLDKALEMEAVRAKLVRGVVGTPFYIAFASDLLYRGIRDYVGHQAEAANRIPGAGSMMKLGKSMLNRARPDLEGSVEQGLRKYIEKSVSATAAQSAELLLHKLDNDTLRGMALEIWQGIKHAPVATIKQDISALDVEEMFVLGYAFWGDFRRSRYLVSLLEAGIDSFFALYGNQTLTTLLDDLGITDQMMMDEGMRFAPPVIKALVKKGLLEPVIRRLLADFYASDAVRDILARS